jgi:SAM-dependent methyltransferase
MLREYAVKLKPYLVPNFKKITLFIIKLVGVITIVKFVNIYLRKIVNFSHKVQFNLEWSLGLTANWFDHNLDLYYLWHQTRTPLCWERGIFSLLAMRQGARVLELCCGDGFYANYFYSTRAASVVSIDIDANAIQTAQKNYSPHNVQYLVANVLTQMPEGIFDNVVWDSALEYFTKIELQTIIQKIKIKLSESGILSGYVVIQNSPNEGQKYAFRSKDDLLELIEPYFSNIYTFETVYLSRHNLYFFASEGPLPFDNS